MDIARKPQNLFLKPAVPAWKNNPNSFFTTKQEVLKVENQPVVKFHLIKQENKNSLHSSLGPVLTVGQICGLLPVYGIHSSHPKYLRQKLNSYLGWYTTFMLLSMSTLACLSLIHTARSLRSETFTVLGGLGAATAGTVFYSNAAVATFLFWRLAAKWRPLMMQWAAVEHQISHTCPTPPRARTKTLALAATVLILATAEHGLSIATHSNSNSLTEWLKDYSLSSHAFIFSTLEYSFGLGLAVQILSRVATVTWNFTDLFLMIIGQSLTLRFNQFNESLLKRSLNKYHWGEARTQFANLAKLTRCVDAEISGIIFLSFSNNLYFICLQLLNGLTPIDGDHRGLHSIYFWASFIFLLSRTAAVTIFLSNVHVASKNGLPAVYACPSSSYSQDTERLLNQMSTDELSLTGLGLFHVTRSFLLAVAGAIATYEVVLLQFNVAITQPANSSNGTNH